MNEIQLKSKIKIEIKQKIIDLWMIKVMIKVMIKKNNLFIRINKEWLYLRKLMKENIRKNFWENICHFWGGISKR